MAKITGIAAARGPFWAWFRAIYQLAEDTKGDPGGNTKGVAALTPVKQFGVC